MAKVSGPLMSMDASGKFGGTLVFGKWKGRNTVRHLVIPTNPKTQTQEDARNAVRVTGIIQHFVSATLMLLTGQTKTDKARLQGMAPNGQAWNGYLVQQIIGKQSSAIAASDAGYALLTAPQKTAWDDAAAALVPAISPAPQYDALGMAGTPKTAGNVFYNYVSGLNAAGLAPMPGAVPPTYA